MIYLDYAAATPVRPEVLRVMKPFFQDVFANPSSITKAGVRARKGIEQSRVQIATALGARPDELIFTSSGTESINLAIRGVMEQFPRGHMIISAIEHHAVFETVQELVRRGHELTVLPVDHTGQLSPKAVLAAVRPNTRLVSVMLANNEIGTILPVQEIAEGIRRLNRQRKEAKLAPVLVHTDACQAFAYLPVNVATLDVDLLSLNAAKIGGPKGVGLLYRRRLVALSSQMTGGGQEQGYRAGTENVPGIVGFGEAVRLADKERAKETQRIQKLAHRLLATLTKALPNIRLNGDSKERLANNLSLTIPDIEAEPLVLYLDNDGVAVGTGAACTSQTLEPSHVLLALGLSRNDALATIRITLGRETTTQAVDQAVKAIIQRITWLRKAASTPKRK